MKRRKDCVASQTDGVYIQLCSLKSHACTSSSALLCRAISLVMVSRNLRKYHVTSQTSGTAAKHSSDTARGKKTDSLQRPPGLELNRILTELWLWLVHRCRRDAAGNWLSSRWVWCHQIVSTRSSPVNQAHARMSSSLEKNFNHLRY